MNVFFEFLKWSFLVSVVSSGIVYDWIPEKNLFSFLLFVSAYIIFGFVVLVKVPALIRKRMQEHQNLVREKTGFKPSWAVAHNLDQSYLGFDGAQKKFLLIDQVSKREILFDSNDVNVWEIEQKNSSNAVVRFLTDLPNNPVIEMVININHADTIRSRMYSVFGV